jgi:hypothetical protein
MMRLRIGFILLLTIASARAAERVAVPCYITQLSIAADASGLWFACSQHWAEQMRAQRESREAPAYGGANNDPTDVYWLAASSATPLRIASAKESIDIVPAPEGSAALIVLPQQHGSGQPVLFRREKRVRELPMDAYFLLWASDAQSVYFEAGNTTESDAWNIAGIYVLKNGSAIRRTLKEPTAILRTCAANRHVFSVMPSFPGNAGSTVEYTADLRFLRRRRTYVGGHFSAHCRYVASESDYHGPLPWAIYEVRTGMSIVHFEAVDEDVKRVSYQLVAWNPRYDSLLLRRRISGEGKPDAFEVFDVRSRRVSQTIVDADLVAWSSSGTELVSARGSVLVWHSLAV